MYFDRILSHRTRALWGVAAAFVALAPQLAFAQAQAEPSPPLKKAEKAEKTESAEPSQSEAPASARGVYERDVVDVDPAAPVTLLAVDNRLGDVRIQGHDSPKIVISAYKRALDQETLERLKVTLVPDENGSVRIATSLTTGREARPIPSGSITVDLVVHAPRSARLDAQVWNGQLMVVGMENGAELSSNSGAIGVKNASGSIVTHSASGGQTFQEIFGTVEAQSIGGRMDLEVVRGKRLDASVHDGRIDGREVRVSEMSLRATKGDIRMRAQALAGGNYQIGTFSGHIEVEFAAGAPMKLLARSRRGSVTLPDVLAAHTDDSGALRAAISGKGKPAMIQLRSRVGNIQFTVLE